jgi:hypothetical protein
MIIMVRPYYHHVASICLQRSALREELNAVLDGLSLALHLCTQPLIGVMDCLEIVKLLQNEDMDCLGYTTI